MAGDSNPSPDMAAQHAGNAVPRSSLHRCRPGGSMPRVGVIYNPRSHRNKGVHYEKPVEANVITAGPKDKQALAQVLADFARDDIDLLIVNGGDGTVRDVLTSGYSAFGNDWPCMAVMPRGKTNALNVDLGAPANWSVDGCIKAWQSGKRRMRVPMLVEKPGGQGAPLLGFVMGAGIFTTATRVGQDAHKLGAFDSLAVGVTAGWGVLQALFGSNRNIWRRGTPMRVWLGEKREELPHSRYGPLERRSLLFASTLDRFPLGMQPFAERGGDIGLTVMDRPRRRLVAALPAVVAGMRPSWIESAGFYQRATGRFELTIDDDYILDGEAFSGGDLIVRKGPQIHFVAP
ncbi:MAG: diacylglycerol/lipid kinase family protein [Sphingomonadaceae bacterium]